MKGKFTAEMEPAGHAPVTEKETAEWKRLLALSHTRRTKKKAGGG
jgi:hypothetical protein